MKAVQCKYPAAPWHAKYRTMDDICHSIRLFREHHASLSSEEKIDHDTMLETEQCVAGQLTDMLKDELEELTTFSGDKIGAAVRLGGNAIGSTPIARRGHYVYGLLDLIQQHVSGMVTGKFDQAIIELLLKVVQVSKYSYLRCKAFEVLAVFSSKHGVGQMPIQHVAELLRCGDIWSKEEAPKVSEQWRTIRNKVIDVEHFTGDLKNKLPPKALLAAVDEGIVPIHEILAAQEAMYAKVKKDNDALMIRLERYQRRVDEQKRVLQEREIELRESKTMQTLLSDELKAAKKRLATVTRDKEKIFDALCARTMHESVQNGITAAEPGNRKQSMDQVRVNLEGTQPMQRNVRSAFGDDKMHNLEGESENGTQGENQSRMTLREKPSTALLIKYFEPQQILEVAVRSQPQD
jgi:hypothetical protein